MRHDRRILAAAAVLEPSALRTLDAIHLATALVVREDLDGLVTYDRRLAAAAERLDLEVLAPALTSSRASGRSRLSPPPGAR